MAYPHIRVVERPKHCVPEGISMHNTLNITRRTLSHRRKKFTISRGSKTEVAVAVCAISNGSRQGRGECVPYALAARVSGKRKRPDRGRPLRYRAERRATRQDIQNLMPAGAAVMQRKADCAYGDSKQSTGKALPICLVCRHAPSKRQSPFRWHARNGGISRKVAHYPLYQGENGR